LAKTTFSATVDFPENDIFNSRHMRGDC